jgi:hypothetical protein
VPPFAGVRLPVAATKFRTPRLLGSYKKHDEGNHEGS